MSKDEFYNSITEDTTIDEDFLKALHAYSLYDPQYLLDVLQKFDGFGRKRVADLFTIYMFFHKEARNEELLPAARWLRRQIDEEYERKRKAGEEQRRQEEIELLERKRQLLMKKSQTLTGE